MRLKKFVATALCAAMLLTGSGFASVNASAEELQNIETSEEVTSEEEITEEATEEVTEAEEILEENIEDLSLDQTEITEEDVIEAEDEELLGSFPVKIEENKVVVISLNDEVKNLLDTLYVTYPEYKSVVQYVDFGELGLDYNFDNVKALLDSSKNNTVIFTEEFSDIDNAEKLSDLFGTLEPTALADIGFDVDKYKKSSFKYIYDGSIFNNKLYFASWQACTGAVLYNKSIAKKVLGTDDPDKVQEAIKDWDTLYNTAVAADEAGYSIVSGMDTLDMLFGLDEEYLDKLAPLSKEHEMWSEEWGTDMENGDVFLWFGCTWFDPTVIFAGDAEYGIIPGPQGYYWGGTCLGVFDKGACETEAAEIIELLCCNFDIQEKILNGEMPIYVNNTYVISDYIRNNDTGSFDYYSAGNPLKAWYMGASNMAGQDYDVTIKTVPMYRIYNPNSGEHFYTASVGEKDYLVSLGWNYEGIGWNAPEVSRTPVYRLYNENAGDHHYTTSAGERDHLVSVGWKYEGIGWYSDDNETVPLYRQYNPNAIAGAHNFTANLAENDWLVSLGWNAENIGWYGVK